jgi:hypothetical protein
MKLYDLPRGAYSRCYDQLGNLVHLSASTPVQEVSKHEPEAS